MKLLRKSCSKCPEPGPSRTITDAFQPEPASPFGFKENHTDDSTNQIKSVVAKRFTLKRKAVALKSRFI